LPLQKVFRILVIADSHCSGGDDAATPEEALEPGDLWPHYMARLKPQAAFELLGKIRRALRMAWDSMLGFAREYKPDLIALAGDSNGGWQETGSGNPKLSPLLNRMSTQLNEIAPASLAPGNHESGYGPGEFRLDSLEAMEKHFGPLWWVKECGRLMVLGMCTPLEAAKTSDPRVEQRQLEQRAFFKKLAAEKLISRPWILIAHDLGAARSFPKMIPELIRDYAIANRRAFIVGDKHNPGTFWIFRILAKFAAFIRRDQHASELLAEVHLCPSVAPLWWEGYGALTIEWNDRVDEVIVKQVRIPKPAGHYHILPESMLKACLWWRPGRVKQHKVAATSSQQVVG